MKGKAHRRVPIAVAVAMAATAPDFLAMLKLAPAVAAGMPAVVALTIRKAPAFWSDLRAAFANRIPIAATAVLISATVGFSTKMTAGLLATTNAPRQAAARGRTATVRPMAWAKATVADAAIAAPACQRRICISARKR